MIRKLHVFTIYVLLLSSSLIAALEAAEATEKIKDLEHMILDFRRAEDKASLQILNDGEIGGICQSEILFGEIKELIIQYRNRFYQGV